MPNPFILKHQLRNNLAPFNRQQVQKLPRRRTGVYAIWLPADDPEHPQCIYIGMSEACLRTRLLNHLSSETNPMLRREMRMFRDIIQFSLAYTQGREQTLELESEIIRSWNPLTNRAHNSLRP